MIRLAAAACLGLFSSAAFPQAPAEAAPYVASATSVSGPVQFNAGDRFLPLRAGQGLAAGDRVMALRDGTSTLTFADGCTLLVAPETLVTVPPVSDCAGGIVAVQAVAPGSAQAVGTAVAASAPTASGAGLIVGAVVLGNALLFSEDEQNTVSP